MPPPRIQRQVHERLEELYAHHRDLEEGAVTGFYDAGTGFYAPELAGPETDQFGLCLVTTDGHVAEVGDTRVPFALQSVSKVFTYGCALEDRGREHVLERVGVEPSGDTFYALEFDERHNRPYNPMVNAGAIVTADCVRGEDPDAKFARILDAMRRYAGNGELRLDEDTFSGEVKIGDRNRAAAYLMRSRGMLSGDVEATLAVYLKACSVTVTCRDLAVMAATLANGAVNPVTGERVLPRQHVRDVLSVMYTCGMYDFAGQWAYEVGFPAKSGVSGAILAVIPGKMGLGVYSPGLDVYGNSVRGARVCEELSDSLGLHVFATETEDELLGEPPT